jgi:orotidine-5'-phosphate decarboxylase
VGLDSDIDKIPAHLLPEEDAIFQFNREIIEATKDYAVAYKLNLAFYEEAGIMGWESLAQTLELVPDNILTIADAKRGDIGNTATKYARAIFETYNFDAITVAPYMGEDSIRPFLEYEDKWTILLGLTSNKGSNDFQMLESGGEPVYKHVIRKAQEWGTPDNLMFVIGATHPEMFREIREIAPQNFFLVPGVGAQGGDLEAVSKNGMNDQCGLLVNSSRGIIFAGSGDDFGQKAGEAAAAVQQEMSNYLPVQTV